MTTAGKPTLSSVRRLTLLGILLGVLAGTLVCGTIILIVGRLVQ